MTRILFLTLALIIGLILPLHAQQGISAGAATVAVSDTSIIAADGSYNDYNKVINKFFSLIDQDKTDDAIDFIFSNNKWFAKSPDELNELKTELQKLGTLVGKNLGHDKLFEEQLTDHLVYVSYFVRYEREPVKFVFEFYKPKDKWQTYLFKFDDKLSSDLEFEVKEQLVQKVKKEFKE